jgi:integrase
LLDQVHDTIRRKYYSRRTEEAYVHWIKRFIYFTGKRHPGTLGEPEVTAFLSHLAVKLHVAAATQNQALSALLFLYKEVLGQELGWLDGVQRATRPPRLPTVLTHEEVERLLACMVGTRWLLASLLYGAGLRVIECLRLRVKDVDLSYRQILVRDGKGEKDRVTMLPEKLIEPLRAHLERACCTRATCARAMARCTCLTRSRASTRALAGSGAGNTYFRPRTARPTRTMGSSAGITWTNRCRSARSRWPRAWPASTSR